ncbi:HD family phosphohydrolase [Paenibacillus darwinianus]|uniref:HD family phosphohydrolase n=1 Tax=Paenibacillus darwinianus TaxID=1380763 RepID=A0A9W5RZY7_9BACL|nr:HD domain-containing phosphohydrolase [Paenibacillus darwinianus]EXX85365.1 HD family phosphohydrolase [Paenibacillus darwinianus]EXX85722.1 HD family phosphohydrolase [Paenibacillus darwinianus]EXX85748.1 HD family phosphohydrolase [Paenibacillus darwinianus]
MSWLEIPARSLPTIGERLASAGLKLEMAILVAGFAIFALLMLIWAVRQGKKARLFGIRFERARKVIQSVRPERGLENNLEAFLELYEQVIEAPVYSFYMQDERSRGFVLKAVRHRTGDFGKIRPSYSGLAGYKKEDYHPPLSLPAAEGAPAVRLLDEGEVPLLAVMTGDGKGQVRIGPFSGKLKRRQRLALEELGTLIGPGLAALIDTERLTSQAEVVVASGQALRQINRIAIHPDHTMELMTRLSVKTIGASSGCYVELRGSEYRTPVLIGLAGRTERMLQADQATLEWFDRLLSDGGYHYLRRGEERFGSLPEYMTGKGVEAIAAVMTGQGSGRYLVFWFNRIGGEEQEQTALSTIRLIHHDLRTLTGLQLSLKQLSGTYTGILKGLAQLLDNLSPYTIGYSELMSRYAIIIAKELGLSGKEITDIALAAYLSNIGMLGITIDLYQKEGKYTDQEFELMKLHSEVGASIVRMTIGNEQVAEYILYHHERMDGNGYPANLKGDEIPMGSRIIAVIQTFLAKINGRKYRDPLPFHQALHTLRAAAGTQLDPQVVEAFIRWFERKQRNPQFQARSLGSCWEMGCVPSDICESCPVYRRTDVNCWEVEGNNCSSHGKSCETCFVRTEYVYRSESLKRA